MGDAAGAITKDVDECWGSGPERVMWLAHTTRAVDRSDYLKALRAIDAEFSAKVLEDFDELQWMIQNEASFRAVFELF